MPSKRRKCCIKNCPGLNKPGPKVLFRFPLKEPKRSEWFKNCVQSFQKILELRQPLICNIHFEKNHLGKKKLYCGAVPTLYLNNADDSTTTTKYIKEKMKIRCGEIYKIQDDDEDYNNYNILCTICRNIFEDIEKFTKHIDIFHNDIMFQCKKDSSDEKNDELSDKIVDEEIIEAELDSCTSETNDLNLNKGFLKFSEINTENEDIEMDLETANKCLNDSLLLNIESEKDQDYIDDYNKNKSNNCSNLIVQEINIDKNQEHFNVCNQNNLPNSSSSNENNSSSLILREIQVEQHENINYNDKNKSDNSNLMVREIKYEKDHDNVNDSEENNSTFFDENEYHRRLNLILPQIKVENEQEDEMETSFDDAGEETELDPNDDNNYNTNTIQVSDDQNEIDRSFLNTIIHLKDDSEITIIKISGKKKT